LGNSLGGFVDFKFRPIGVFDAQVVGVEPVKSRDKTAEQTDDKWQISFACPGRIGSGDKGKTASTEAVAALIGGVVKSKVSKRYLGILKSLGFNVGAHCVLHAAIDHYAIAAEGKSKGAAGIWFELLEVQIGDKKAEAPVEQRKEAA
jgi:hypothetical protein